ncbi:FAD-binding oxidoreductase [Candidatus Kaiserbacteria bacterium]|nr:FAD-binding oxidoreductase [Candidatus Kaiserbacteria bacterium]
MSELREKLAHIIKGDVNDDAATLAAHSRDTSIFERRPKIVVFPKDPDDVSAVVKYVGEAKGRGEEISLAARSAGTDMTGGDLTDSVSLSFIKYMNHIGEIGADYGVAEPGVYYRDFEKASLAKGGLLLPSYPASKELCAIGGIVSNNSGGELTLRYGKTNDYVEELDVVLSDGSKATFRELSTGELAEKEKQQGLEGDIYRKVHALIDANAEMIENARPTVTKNSAGYALWNVVDRKRKTFDLSQLICGSQGTLALVTKAKLALVKPPEHRAMMITFLSDITILPEIVHRVLKFDPESYESYDKYTFKLAVRFLPQLLGQMGIVKMIKLGFAFIPEMLLVFTGGVPQFVLMAEFAEHTHDEALQKAEEAAAALHDLHVRTTIAKSESQAAKYWTVRRESFNLLRKHMPGLSAAPFIDDFVVHPDDYPTFLPELDSLLSRYHLTFTVAGHIGDGNFHIFPFIDMSSAPNREIILELGPKVYELVVKYHGSITGEHNDGIVRTPYLPLMFGEKVCALFAEVKKIFDPLNILNPGK